MCNSYFQACDVISVVVFDEDEFTVEFKACRATHLFNLQVSSRDGSTHSAVNSM